MKTPAAWDERKHPTIVQFLRDIRRHTIGICGAGDVSLTILNLELDRLAKKVCCTDVDARIDDLRHALSSLHLVPQVRAAKAGSEPVGENKLSAPGGCTVSTGEQEIARPNMSQLAVGDLVTLEDNECEMLVVGSADEVTQPTCSPSTWFCVWECDHRMFEEVFAEDMLRLLRKERRRIPRPSDAVFPGHGTGTRKS
ncbi:hypothetical protein SR858_09850 [Duganella zoogloeoides]|uniref:Uncharacterized protein n=1 Tax=Duganella zoogloeoides TaxID=75659 RepID=A0ABZ0Y554_9BURK|nr:hypothetical protein [Duganella zoogloeoides]WQH06602.1 hypothetical protein SR858_09850 [Duganella zoogloeoides]